MGFFGFAKNKKQYRKNGILEFPDDRKFFLGQPAVYPSELVRRLTGYLASINYIGKVFLAQIHIQDDEYPPHPLISIQVIKSSTKDFNAIQKELAPLIKGSGTELVDFMEIGATANLNAPIFKNFKVIYDKSIA